MLGVGIELVLKASAAAAVVFAAVWLGERGHYQLAGIAATFPAVLFISALILGLGAEREQMQGFASGALGGIAVLVVFLGAYALALRLVAPLAALGAAALIWALAAALLLAVR